MKFQKKSKYINAQEFLKLRYLLRLVRKSNYETLQKIDEACRNSFGRDWLEKIN